MSRRPTRECRLCLNVRAPCKRAGAGCTGRMSKCRRPLRAAGPPPWAAIATSAPSAGIRPSLITLAEIAIARSARRRPVTGGSPNGNRKCCQWATSTSCSLSHMNCPRLSCRTKRRSTVCCSRRYLAGSRRQSRTSGSRHWFSQHSAHLGAEPVASPSRALRRTGRRDLARPDAVDPFRTQLSRACPGAEGCVPGESSRWSEAAIPRRETGFRGPTRGSVRLEIVPRLPGAVV